MKFTSPSFHLRVVMLLDRVLLDAQKILVSQFDICKYRKFVIRYLICCTVSFSKTNYAKYVYLQNDIKECQQKITENKTANQTYAKSSWSIHSIRRLPIPKCLATLFSDTYLLFDTSVTIFYKIKIIHRIITNLYFLECHCTCFLSTKL